MSEAHDAGPMRPAYRTLSQDEQARIAQIKQIGTDFWRVCDSAEPSREMSLAKTKIEEAVMWAVKAISA